jgi:hypothetical protein
LVKSTEGASRSANLLETERYACAKALADMRCAWLDVMKLRRGANRQSTIAGNRHQGEDHEGLAEFQPVG